MSFEPPTDLGAQADKYKAMADYVRANPGSYNSDEATAAFRLEAASRARADAAGIPATTPQLLDEGITVSPTQGSLASSDFTPNPSIFLDTIAAFNTFSNIPTTQSPTSAADSLSNLLSSTITKENLMDVVKRSVVGNPLDQYANYTYHVKFWITSEFESQKLTNIADPSSMAIDTIPKVIIAESGVTAGFNIREFSYKNICGTTGETRNLPSVSWNMTITEPYGFSLPDRINSAALKYGIPNWQRGKYFVEVWFTGYDNDGTPVATKLFYKIYGVTITNMVLGGTSSGATYEISGIFDGMHGFTNSISMQDATLVVGGSTVGEFFDRYATALNGNAEQLAYGSSTLTHFVIVVPNIMRKWNLNPGKILENDQSAKALNPKKDGFNVTLTMSRGTDIGQIVYYVLSLANEAKAWVEGTDGSGGAGVMTHGLVKDIKIHSKMEYIGFDIKTGEYIKRITYTLIPYEQVRVRDDQPSVRNAELPSVQYQKIKYLTDKGRIRKQYQWIYTGKNLDIIRFDFKVNNFWTIATPPYGGVNTTSSQVQGKVAAESSAAWAQHDGRYKTIKAAGNALVDARNVIVKKISDGPLSVIGSGVNFVKYQTSKLEYPGLKQQLEEIDNKISANTLLQQQELQSLINLRQVSFTDPLLNAISNNPLAQAIQTKTTQFASDFNSGALYAEDQAIIDESNAAAIPFINTVIPNSEASTANTNQAAAGDKPAANNTDALNLPRSRTLFGSAIGNLDSVNKEMMNIVLDIRGDPYWMGHSNIEQNSKVPDQLDSLSSDYAELLSGDNMFFLSFRSGQSPNEETGFIEFDNNTQYVDGFYSVTEVTNTFKDGQFIQNLKSFKDTMSQHASNAIDGGKLGKILEQQAALTPKEPYGPPVPDTFYTPSQFTISPIL